MEPGHHGGRFEELIQDLKVAFLAWGLVLFQIS